MYLIGLHAKNIQIILKHSKTKAYKKYVDKFSNMPNSNNRFSKSFGNIM